MSAQSNVKKSKPSCIGVSTRLDADQLVHAFSTTVLLKWAFETVVHMWSLVSTFTLGSPAHNCSWLTCHTNCCLFTPYFPLTCCQLWQDESMPVHPQNLISARQMYHYCCHFPRCTASISVTTLKNMKTIHHFHFKYWLIPLDKFTSTCASFG